ncbi:MAG: disulfide bond formation protein B [Lysobacterales bacterium]|nr:MAG: disulfide bond formation protein B [Xanthomonadales bacterium]
MSYALYAQHVLGLDVCPLCVLQRMIIITLGLVLAVAALHAPRGAGARVYAVLGALVALVGMGVSGWHVRLQNLPPGEVPSCGPGYDYIMDTFGPLEGLSMIFTASGECAEVNWSWLGLSMPAWVFIWFVALGALAVAANWSRLSR